MLPFCKSQEKVIKMKRERSLFYAFIVLASVETAGLLFFALLPSVVTVETGFLRPGDLEHLLAYTVYGFLLSGVFYRLPGPGKAWSRTLVAGCFVGIVFEFIQLFVPTRTADPVDAIVNCTGVFTGLVISRYVIPRIRKAASL
jgi:VanZ family protein